MAAIGTSIASATVKRTRGTITGDEYVPLGTSAGSDSMSVKLDELKAWSNEENTRWNVWDGAARSSNSVIASTTVLAEGTPIRYRATSGTWRYGVVDSISGSDHTINGYYCSTADDDEFQYGHSELIVQRDFLISSTFADATETAANAGGSLYADEHWLKHYMWEYGTGHLACVKVVCYGQDSTVDPTLQVAVSTNNIAFNDMLTGPLNIDNTLVFSEVKIDLTYNTINKNDYVDFTITVTGTGDAEDLFISLIFVLE